MTQNLEVICDTLTPAETLGKVRIGNYTYDTLEQPLNHDLPDHSCIPRNVPYRFVAHTSGHLHERDGVTPLRTYAMVNEAAGVFHHATDVPPDYAGNNPVRTECLWHPANFVWQLEGCCAPGMSRQKQPDGIWRVIDSWDAFDAVRGAIDAAFAAGDLPTVIFTAPS